MKNVIFTKNREKLIELDIPFKELLTDEGIYYEVYIDLLTKEEIDAIR